MVGRAVVSALSRPLGDASALAPSPGAARRDVTAPPDDATLVARVIAGDRAGEEALYRRHAPRVLRLATRLLRSNQDASDVLQDAFVSAFEDLSVLREPEAFRAWVHRITVRLVHRRFRRRRLLGMLGLDRKNDEVSLESLADDSRHRAAVLRAIPHYVGLLSLLPLLGSLLCFEDEAVLLVEIFPERERDAADHLRFYGDDVSRTHDDLGDAYRSARSA